MRESGLSAFWVQCGLSTQVFSQPFHMGFAAQAASDLLGSVMREPKQPGRPLWMKGLHNKAAWEVKQDLFPNFLLPSAWPSPLAHKGSHFFSPKQSQAGLLLCLCIFSCTCSRGWSILWWVWAWCGLQHCAGLHRCTAASLSDLLCVCVCINNPFITWEWPTDVCVGLFKGGKKKGWLCSAGWCQAVFIYCVTLGLHSASGLFIWICWQ